MASLKSQIESLLFMAAKPMTLKSLAKILKLETEDIALAVQELAQDYKVGSRGLQIAQIEDQIQLTSTPENAQLLENFVKDETSGDLTRPSLETLTVIAYRGPISKPELEMIRGVNCSLILRNLLLRGLVEEYSDTKTGLVRYNITFDFLRYLGLSKPSELPDYDKLSSHEILERWLTGQSGTPAENTGNTAGNPAQHLAPENKWLWMIFSLLYSEFF